MATQFKPILNHGVMCTIQGCGEVAEFYARYPHPLTGELVLAAYCEVHARLAAKRISYPWLIPAWDGARAWGTGVLRRFQAK
jgi:hypothetical protein